MFSVKRQPVRGKYWRRDARSGGQSLVEFALVVPLFFFVIFAIIQLGLLFGAQNGVVAAARDAARYSSTYRVAAQTDATAVCPLAKAYLKQRLLELVVGADPSLVNAPGGTKVTYTWLQNPDGPGGTPGSYYVEITIAVLNYPYPLYVPLVSNIIDSWDGATTNPPTAKLSANEQMRIENQGLAGGVAPVTC
jgi:Flp pilus assembly protein TadG